MLEENGINNNAITGIIVPTNVIQFTTYKKDDAKARRIIVDGVKDHFFLHIMVLDTMKKT